MKFTAKHVFIAEVLSWILIWLPFFVPAINKIEPRVLGLPFIVVYDIVIIALHTALLIFAKQFVWDTFDADIDWNEKGDK